MLPYILHIMFIYIGEIHVNIVLLLINPRGISLMRITYTVRVASLIQLF